MYSPSITDFVFMVQASSYMFVTGPSVVKTVTSKELAVKAGVPVIPRHVEALKDEEEALSIAVSIGYPVLLKPAAGGGQGHVVHLGERECSIQRRYQKIIEESPATAVDPQLRERMGRAVRVDSGLDAGSKIGVYYDSMLAKVICHGEDLEAARSALVEALNGYHIEGIVTNVDFANNVLCHPAFVSGDLDTDFIQRHFDGALPLNPVDDRSLKLSAVAAALIFHVRARAVRESVSPMVSRIGGSKETAARHRYFVRSGESEYEVSLEKTVRGHCWSVLVEDETFAVETPDFEFYRRRLKTREAG